MVDEKPSAPNGSSVRAERDRFVAFAFAAADLLLEVDAEGRIAFATGASQAMTQRAADALTGTSLFEIVAPTDRALAKVLLASLGRRGRFSPVPVRLADPGEPPALLGGCRLPDDQGGNHLTFTLLPANGEHATPGARAPQTGLLSKDDFSRLAERWLKRPDRSDYRVSLVDVPGIASLRERADDELSAGFLAALGRQIRAQSADGDAAGELAHGRFGVIHRGQFDADALHRQMAELAAAVELDGDFAVSKTSLDLSAADLSAADMARTLVYAINSFAQARRGEFTLTSLSAGFRALMAETATKVRDLRGTLASREFALAYQPIVALADRAIHHYEALSRFPGRGAAGASPAEVVEFAERIGVIAEFDLSVCQRAISALEAFPDAARRPSVAINFSGRSLESAIFAAEIDALVRANPKVAPNLMFEITESAQIVQMNEVQNFLQSLRKRGFKVCLDDFGAGAASFHYLNAFPVDFVKIDGKYVRNLPGSPRVRAFLKAMAMLCRDLGTAAIAEMVETEDQAAEVATLGIAYGQGYLFGRPGPSFGAIGPAVRLHQQLSAREALAAMRGQLQASRA